MKLSRQQATRKTLVRSLLVAAFLVPMTSQAQVTVPPITLPQATLPTGGKNAAAVPAPTPAPLPKPQNPGTAGKPAAPAAVPTAAPVVATPLPATINYQGFLTDQKTGAPINASLTINFKIYDALTGGNLLYSEDQFPSVSNGVFNAQIGSITRFPATLIFDKPYWLEVKVDGGILTPRQAIASSAFARSAGMLPSRVGGNTAAGDGTLLHTSGPDNTAVGTNALTLNTTGYANTALGSGVLASNIDGYGNTAAGAGLFTLNGSALATPYSAALAKNTSGGQNSAFGTGALGNTTVGSANTAVGFLALSQNTANLNSAFGVDALGNNTTGDVNTAVGGNALSGNMMGRRNVAVGSSALGASAIGSDNVGIGANALWMLYSPKGDNNNIAIGSGSGESLLHGNSNIYIGNPGVNSESGTIRIGNGANQMHNRVFIAGVRDTNLGTPSDLPVLIDNNGQLGTTYSVSSTSDRNVKENFADVDPAEVLAKVAQLPLLTWNYRTDRNKVKHLGPMAQDFHAAFNIGQDEKHITMVDADGVALAAIQGLYRMVQDKDAELAQLKSSNKALLARVEALEDSTREQMALLKQTMERLLAQSAQPTQVVLMHPSH